MASSIFRSTSAGIWMRVESAIVERNPAQSCAANRVCFPRSSADLSEGAAAGKLGALRRAHATADLVGQRAVFRLHLVVLEDNCDRVFALSVNVSRLFHDHQVFGV